MNKNLKNAVASTIFCLLFLFPGCGGGSRGTGSLTIEGRVLTTRGNSIQNADVTNLETGTAGKTDQAGNFSLVTERQSGDLSFLVETASFQVTSTGGGQVSDDASTVSVQIVINTESSSPTARQDVVVRERQPSGSTGSSSSSNSSSSSVSSSSSSSSSNSSASSNSSSSNSSSNSSSSSQSSQSSSSSNSSSSSSSSEDDDEVRVEGPIQNLTSTTVTVRSITFTVNNNTDYGNRDRLSDFSIGENVEARGEFRNGVLIAERVRLK